VEIRDNKAVFTVRDDGCGIPEDKLSGIFSGSLDSRRSSDTGRSNMGIGLSVCAAIIRAHGGEIWARNLEKGAEFSFALEMEAEDEQQ